MSESAETVGVLSDTHLSGPTPELLRLCEDHFKDCQRLLHAGDVVSGSVLDALSERWHVEAVRGNMDFAPELARLPRRRLVTVGGLSIGLIHGGGAPAGIEQRVVAAFAQGEEDPPPVIIHGHTHRPVDDVLLGVRILNPGSATEARHAPHRSVGRLTVDRGGVRFEILPVA